MRNVTYTQRAVDRPKARLRLCPDNQAFTATSRAAFALIIIMFLAARFWNLTAYGLFSDEVFSAQIISLGWREMIDAIIRDVVHPPLFYLLLKAWVLAGHNSLLWMKLFPVAIAAASITPFYLLCRQLKLAPWAINLAFFLIAANEYLINYAQELRMYSLLFLLSASSLCLFAKLVNAARASIRLQLALFGANLLLIFAHYYGWLIVAAEFLFLLISRRDLALRFSLTLAALIACFLPWFFLVAEAAVSKGGLGPNLNWNVRPKPIDLTWFYAILNGPIYNRWKPLATLFVTVLFITPIFVWAGQVIRRPRPQDAPALLWLSLCSLVPSVIAFAASYVLPQSIWGTRFLIIVAPAYLLLLATAATRLRPGWLKCAAAALMILWAAFSGIVQLANRDKIAWEPLVNRMIEAEPDRSGPIKVYAQQGVAGITIQYYLDNAAQSGLRVEYADDFTQVKEDHFWVAFLKYEHENQALPQNMLMENGYKVGDIIEADAPGHKVFLFPAWRQ